MLEEGRACLGFWQKASETGSLEKEVGAKAAETGRILTSKVLRLPCSPRGAGLNHVSIQGCQVEGAGKRERMPGNWLGVSGEGSLRGRSL